MRKIQIYCDCCGDPCNSLNEITISSFKFNGNYELCNFCMHEIVTRLTKFDNRIKETIEKSILD